MNVISRHTSACVGMVLAMILGIDRDASGRSAHESVTLAREIHAYETGDADAVRVTNEYLSLLVVPERGGRIVSLVDRRTNEELTWIDHKSTSYGGLLDDHGARSVLPYEIDIVEQSAECVKLQLTGDDGSGLTYQKTITVSADRPAIGVTYHILNAMQEPARLLFRNVVRPSGGETSKQDRYSYPTTHGNVHTDQGFGRTDNIGAPWMAYMNVPKQRGLVTVFAGDNLERFYSWRGSVTAPTYEFLYRVLEPGHRVEFTYQWLLVQGLAEIDHADANVVVAAHVLEITESNNATLDAISDSTSDTSPSALAMRITMSAMSPINESIEIQHGLLSMHDPDHPDAPASQADWHALETVNWPHPQTGSSWNASVALPRKIDLSRGWLYKQTLRSGEKILATWEKPIGNSQDIAASGYSRQPQWDGHTTSEPLPGWRKTTDSTAVVTADDQARGYVVYEPFGPSAGEHVQAVPLDLVINEPESLGLYLQALRDLGDVSVAAQLPTNVPADSLTIMMGERVTFVDWGRTFSGWKLPVRQTTKNVTPETQASVWLKINTRGWSPGRYVVPVTITPEQAEPTTVTIELTVHPVRLPDQPPFDLHAHMLINYLSATQNNTAAPWDFDKGLPYMRDLQAHGNRVFNTYGANAMSPQGWQVLLQAAKIRGRDQTLAQAIKVSPELFVDVDLSELPDLDLSYWSPLIQAGIDHGMTLYKTTLPQQDKFSESFIEISRTIFGRAIQSDDPRHHRIALWMMRQITKFVKDNGYHHVLASIGDEIPEDKYANWVKAAKMARAGGYAPGVTQSNALLLHDDLLKQVGPVYDYATIGTMNRALIEQRIAQGLLNPVRIETYESSANYWKTYGGERRIVGWTPGYNGMQGTWIQCYWRWDQAESIIFPTPDGPISTAAWEGARDGMDDANLIQLAMAWAKKDPALQSRFDRVLGMNQTALVPVVEVPSRVGTLTQVDSIDVTTMRQARAELIGIVRDAIETYGHLPATLRYGDHVLVDQDGMQYSLLVLPGNEAHAKVFAQEITDKMGGDIAPAKQTPMRIALATFDQIDAIKQAMSGNDAATMTTTSTADVAWHQDLDRTYPGAGRYVIRHAKDQTGLMWLFILGGDENGLSRGIEVFGKFVAFDRMDLQPWKVR